MINNSFVNYILDMLAPIDKIKSKKMFGGFGIYQDNIFFGLIIKDILYFKVNNTNLTDYKKYKSEPFSYQNKNNKTISLSYFQVPADIIDNQQEFITWAQRSIKAAKSKA